MWRRHFIDLRGLGGHAILPIHPIPHNIIPHMVSYVHVDGFG